MMDNSDSMRIKQIKNNTEKMADANFMYGISIVMEQIAYNVSTKMGDEFASNFTDNMIFSEAKADQLGGGQ